jgi:GT2 family glycosyltransferase
MDVQHEGEALCVTVVVVGYGEMPLLLRCVDALAASEDVSIDIVVVDNGMSEATTRAVADDDRARIVGSGENLGFGGGCNLGVDCSTSPTVAFINPDAMVGAAAIKTLVAALADPEVGIATARLRLLEEPELLNSAGNTMHFLGLGWAEGFRADVATAVQTRPVTGATGAAMAMRRDTFEHVGGFTSELFLYQEDLELSLRCWELGYRVQFVPDADVWHHYEFSRNADKYYYLERNRLILVSTLYEARTIALLLPALIVFEIGIFVVAAKQGWMSEKARGWRWIVANRRWVVAHRRKLQARRVVSDRSLAPLLSSRFDAGQLQMPGLLQPVDKAMALYWRLVLLIIGAPRAQDDGASQGSRATTTNSL